MAVRIRLKQLGRRHRMYYRICVMDSRSPRGGKAIEEVGTYDPMIRDTDKRVTLNGERVDYWLSVGAKPTEQVQRLIEKYKGKVPTVRIDQKKLREVVAAAQKAPPRRKKIEAPAPPPVEASVEAAAEEAVAETAATEASSSEAPSAEPEAAET